MGKYPAGTRIRVNPDYDFNSARNSTGVITDDDPSWVSGMDKAYTVRLDGKSGPDGSGRDYWYMDTSEFKVVEEKVVPTEKKTVTAKVGDKVRVVQDDPELRTGEFVGLVGEVVNTSGFGDKPYKIKFGNGTASHGNKDNGHWWVSEVEVLDTFKPGDQVTWWGGTDTYTVIAVHGDHAWISYDSESDGSSKYTSLLEDLKKVPNFFEVGKTYTPGWNEDARFTVKEIWDTPGDVDRKVAVGFYVYNAEDSFEIPHVTSEIDAPEHFLANWKVAS